MLANRAEPGVSVVTSLPDVSEVPDKGFEGWRAWFVEAARQVMRWVPSEGHAVFYQSDIRRGGAWVDKGYMIARAAEDVGAALIWHKIVCRKPPGTITHGRASYSHMLCVTRGKPRSARNPGPDVMPDAGFMSFSRAMGETACREACRYLRDETTTRVVVDPFCGNGTALAMANAYGFDAIGVDLSARRCRAARKLAVPTA